MEFSRIRGVSEEYRREVGVNLNAGRTNAVEICEKILGAPALDDLLTKFEAHIGKKPVGGTDGQDGHPEAMKSPPKAISASVP